MNETLLVTALGVNPQAATYTFGAGEHPPQVENALAPLALVQLLPEAERPERVLALCTPEAKGDTWPTLRDGLTKLGIEATLVELGTDASDLDGFLTKVSAAIPRGSDAPAALMIDATHGYRHYALLTYLAVQYLSALRKIPIASAYYGLLRQGPDGSSPFLDLRPMLELQEWIHALRVFAEAGDATGLAELIDDGERGQEPAKMAGALRTIAEAREAGLPLELRRESARFCTTSRKPFAKALRNNGALLDQELWEKLDAALEPFRSTDEDKGDGWKSRVVLDRDELARQATLIDDLLERGSLPAALGLMVEWMISRVVLEHGQAARWLDYHQARRPAAGALGALMGLAKDRELAEGLTEDQRRLGQFWGALTELRNALHHHGMRPQPVVGKKADRAREDVGAGWEAFKDLDAALPIELDPVTTRLLVSPVGQRPGALYSALRACAEQGRPADACLLITSEGTEPLVEATLRAAGFDGAAHRLCMEFPHGDPAEIKRLSRAARTHLARAQEVCVNLTGGTTMMGLVASGVADEARWLGCAVRRLGVIDRRTAQAQADDPYVAGEAFWLDGNDDKEPAHDD